MHSSEFPQHPIWTRKLGKLGKVSPPGSRRVHCVYQDLKKDHKNLLAITVGIYSMPTASE